MRLRFGNFGEADCEAEEALLVETAGEQGPSDAVCFAPDVRVFPDG
jgi:hypothetical protein